WSDDEPPLVVATHVDRSKDTAVATLERRFTGAQATTRVVATQQLELSWLLSTPLRLPDRAVGRLTIGRRGPRFTRADVTLAASLARYVAHAVESDQRLTRARNALAHSQHSQRRELRDERLRALESMSRAITHDFNNNLAMIGGIVDLLLADAGAPPTE